MILSTYFFFYLHRDINRLYHRGPRLILFIASLIQI